MSIPKNGVCRKSLPSLKPKYPSGYVLAERELYDLVDQTLCDQMDDFAARMLIVADATSRPFDGRLTEIDVQRLKRVAAESPRSDYQRLMQAILRAVEEDEEGIEAARRTAAYVVALYFSLTREHYFGLKMYQLRLRRSRQAAASRK